MAENLYSPKQKVLTNEGKDNFDRIFRGDACGCFPKNVDWKTAEEIMAMYESRLDYYNGAHYG